MDEPTAQEIINGFRAMPLPLNERAEMLAIYLSTNPRSCATVERIDGSIAHIICSTLIDDFDAWRPNGCIGDPYRRIVHRFKVEMDPELPLNFEWAED
jgi:hypothetical protein